MDEADFVLKRCPCMNWAKTCLIFISWLLPGECCEYTHKQNIIRELSFFTQHLCYIVEQDQFSVYMSLSIYFRSFRRKSGLSKTTKNIQDFDPPPLTPVFFLNMFPYLAVRHGSPGTESNIFNNKIITLDGFLNFCDVYIHMSGGYLVC